MLSDRRRRVRNIIRVLTSRAIEFLDHDMDSSSEEVGDILCATVQNLNEFPDNESSYTGSQSGVWDAFEAIESALDPSALQEASEDDLETLGQRFVSAMNGL